MARRDLRRHAARSALIVALVGLPVAGLTAGFVLSRAATVSGEQRATAMMGTATLRADATSPRAKLDPRLLPGQARVLGFAAADGLLRVGAGDVRQVALSDLPLGDPLAAGMLRLRGGRPPRGPGEVAVGTEVLRELGGRIGGTLRLVRPERSLRITGTLVAPLDVHAWVAVTGPGALGPEARRAWLVALPPGGHAGSELSAANGLAVTTRQAAARLAPGDRGAGRLNLVPVIAGLALMISALVAAAAFAAGVRRELHDLGLLAAVGGDARQLRRAVLARGATLGVAGGLAGAALGIVAALAVYPSLDRIAGHLPRPLALPALPLLGSVATAVLAGTAAALLPARLAGRMAPLDALHARVPAGPPARRVPRLGLLAIVAGCALTGAGALPSVVNRSSGLGVGLALAGLALLLGGFVACSAALVGVLGSLAGRLPLAGRVATRQAARNRLRTGPAVAAITVALAIPIMVSSVLLTARADDRARWRPALADDQLQIQSIAGDGREPPPTAVQVDGREPPAAAVRAVLSAVPGAVAAPLRFALIADQGAGSGSPARKPESGGREPHIQVDVTLRALVPQAEEPGALFVGGDELLAALGADRAAGDLAAGRIVGIGGGTVDHGSVALHPADFRSGDAGAVRDPRARLVQAVQVQGRPVLAIIRYAIGAAAARRLGLETAPLGMLVRAPHAITPAELRAARAALAPYPDLTITAGPGTPPQSVSTSLLALLFGVSAAVALAVVAAMVGLAQAESSPERHTLAAVGAAPALLRRTAGAAAGLLALLGAVLAVPAALLPLLAIYAASPAAAPLTVPWPGLAATVVVVPLLAAAGGAALTRTRPAAASLRARLS
jgi:putative ABC transport system permease protein